MRPYSMPGLTPPPASQTVKQRPWWSRPMPGSPSLPWLKTVRPNSVSEHDERVFEQAALLQVLDQGGGGLVDVVALVGELALDRDVLVPAAVEELHEADVALEQAAGEEAVRRVAAGLCGPRGRRLRCVAADSSLRSVSSGTDVCMRKAIS